MASEHENLAYGYGIALRLKALWPGLSARTLEEFRVWMQTASTPSEASVAELLATGAFALPTCPGCRRPHLVMLQEPVAARIRGMQALSALGDG